MARTEGFSKNPLTRTGSLRGTRRGKGWREEIAEYINTLFYAKPERLQKPKRANGSTLKWSKKTSGVLYMDGNVKCQGRIISWYYYNTTED